MDNTFQETINLNLNKTNVAQYFITPLTPYFLCNHFISTEIHPNTGWKYINCKLNLNSNDLLKNNNYNEIKNFDIIQIQVDFFDFFYYKILPFIIKKTYT